MDRNPVHDSGGFIGMWFGKSQGTGEVLLYENGEAASGSAVSQEDYETTKVRQETYKEEYYDTADLDYTDTETIYIDDEDAVLDSIKVKKTKKSTKAMCLPCIM